MKKTEKIISRKVFDMQQNRINENYGIGAYFIESWENSFAPKLIQNETYVESEIEINDFFHLKDSKSSKEQIHSISSDKEIFKFKTT